MRTEHCYRCVDESGGAELFEPTTSAIGPWSDDLQHGGPVGALLSRAMRRLPGAEGRLARVTVEILGPVAMAPLVVSARVARPGGRIELLEAEARQTHAGTERTVARAAGWRLRTADTADGAHAAEAPLPHPTDDEIARGVHGVPASWRHGFVGSLDWAVRTPIGRIEGPAIAWVAMVGALVLDEDNDPTDRVVAVSDAANGVGSRLDPRDWTFLNTELTVHLPERPSSLWTGLVAESWIGHDGIGMGSAVLHDQTRAVGRVAQSLLVERR